MAYLRSIKQTFFTSEDVVALSRAARLLYIGLWTEADREGRFAWKPLTFKLRYLPTDDDIDIEAVCGELLARRVVVRYGDGLAYIPSFGKHQRPNAKEAVSTLPAPDGRNHPSEREESPVATGETRVREVKERKEEGKEREGEGKTTAAVAAFPRPTPVPMSADAWLELVDGWNRAVMVAPELPRAATTLQHQSRSKLIAALRACPDLKLWDERFERAARSHFLRGRNDRGWVADLMWVVAHADELDAGRYDDREQTGQHSDQDAMWARVLGKAVSQ